MDELQKRHEKAVSVVKEENRELEQKYLAELEEKNRLAEQWRRREYELTSKLSSESVGGAPLSQKKNNISAQKLQDQGAAKKMKRDKKNKRVQSQEEQVFEVEDS